MKIRTDFVTNSSSSSFTVTVRIVDKRGNEVSFHANPFEFCNDDAEVRECDFTKNLADLLNTNEEERRNGHPLKIDNVEKLARAIMRAVFIPFAEEEDEDDEWGTAWSPCDEDSEPEQFDEDWDGEEDEEDEVEDEWDDESEDETFPPGSVLASIAAKKQKFVELTASRIPSVGDIARITVDREYSAWGEYADLIADSDEELCKLAKIVNTTSGDEQEKALEEMLAYIRTPSSERQGESFGCEFSEIRYAWNGGKADLLALAKRLCSDYGPDACEGIEHSEIDLENGTADSYAEFVLC